MLDLYEQQEAELEAKRLAREEQLAKDREAEARARVRPPPPPFPLDAAAASPRRPPPPPFPAAAASPPEADDEAPSPRRPAPPPMRRGDSEITPEKRPSAAPTSEVELYAKYRRMVRAGVPLGAVQQKMRGDGLDPSVLDESDDEADDGAEKPAPPPPKPAPPPPRPEPAAAPVAVIVAPPAAPAKPARKGLLGKLFGSKKKAAPEPPEPAAAPPPDAPKPKPAPPSKPAPPPSKPKPPPPKPAAPAPPPPPAVAPEHAKYFKMLQMGIPRAAVAMKMANEGLDPSVLDGGDDAPAAPPPKPAPPPEAAPPKPVPADAEDRALDGFADLALAGGVAVGRDAAAASVAATGNYDGAPAGAPPGAPVDAKARFDGLDAAAFESTFGMARADFATLPAWRQKAAKQKAGLF